MECYMTTRVGRHAGPRAAVSHLQARMPRVKVVCDVLHDHHDWPSHWASHACKRPAPPLFSLARWRGRSSARSLLLFQAALQGP